MNNQNHETPQALFDKLDKRFRFTLDVCASEQNKKVDHYFDEEIDGLSMNWWPHTCWMNPPFKQTYKWLKKAYEESKKRGITVVALIRNDCSTKYWKEFVKKASERIEINQRVKFIKDKPPQFANVAVVFKPMGLLKKLLLWFGYQKISILNYRG